MGLTFHKSWNPFTSSLYSDLLSLLGPHHIPHHEHGGSYADIVRAKELWDEALLRTSVESM